MNGPPIRLIIPVGLHGRITVVQDNGALDLPFENGVYVCRIPTNGTLRVGSLKPWRLAHEEKAFLTSGQPLAKLLIGDREGPPWEIVVYSLASPGDQIDYFVGTHAQVLEYVARNPPGQTDAGLFVSGQWPTNRPPPDFVKRMLMTNNNHHGNNK